MGVIILTRCCHIQFYFNELIFSLDLETKKKKFLYHAMVNLLLANNALILFTDF